MLQIFSQQKNKGYTIIEMMIAVALFLVIVMSGMGALLNANLLHQKTADTRSILDNLSFVMEDMSKNLRTGSGYHCITGSDTLNSVQVPLSCLSGWGIAFEPYGGDTTNNLDQWVYYIDNTGKLFKSTVGPYVNSSFTQLTPDEVYIDPVSSFAVLGAESLASGNKQQAFITIRLVGKITSKGVVTPFSLQNSISQRLLDV